jgi:hypothetical protein
MMFTADGLTWSGGGSAIPALGMLRRQLERLPEDTLFTRRERWSRRARRLAGKVARQFGLRR